MKVWRKMFTSPSFPGLTRESRPPIRLPIWIPACAGMTILISICSILQADFEDIGVGARPIGMGNAFVGLADDARALAYNPAGLANIRRSEFSADYGRLLTNLDDNSNFSSGFIAFAQPIRRKKSLEERIRDLRHLTAMETQIETSTETRVAGSLELEKRSEKIALFKDWGTLGLGLNNLTLSGAYSENTFWASYGTRILEKLSTGFSVKTLYQSYTMDLYTQTDPVFNYGKRSDLLKFSFDAGLLYNLYPRIFWGLAFTDMNRPNVALNPQDKELLPLGLKSGIAFKDQRSALDLDTDFRDSDYRIQAGAERWFSHRTYALRAGGGFGSRNYENITYGMSLNLGNIQIDYAFLYPVSGVTNTYGSHRVSFVYRFGKTREELEPGSMESYYSKLQVEAEMLRSRLEKAEDERSRLEKVLIEEALSRIKEKVRAEKLESGLQTGAEKRETSKVGKILPALTGTGGTISGMKTYVTSRGDTLQSISELFYGKKERWIEILNLNRDKVGRGGALKSGTVLLIPGVKGTAPQVEEILSNPQSRFAAPERFAPRQNIAGGPPPEENAETRQAPSEGMKLEPLKEKPEKKKPLRKEKAEAPARLNVYTVLPGDTLSSIAEKVYGDPERWKDIYNANKDKVERGAVSPGQILTLP